MYVKKYVTSATHVMSNRHMQVLLLWYQLQQEDTDTLLNSWHRAQHNSAYDTRHYIAWYNALIVVSSLHRLNSVMYICNCVVDA